MLPPTQSCVISYWAPAVGYIYILEQPFLLVSGGTTGLKTWEASLLLTEYLFTQDLKGKDVLELGAGTGLVSITAAKLGAQVLATDGSPTVIETLSNNASLNDVDFEREVLTWGSEGTEGLEKKFDLVIGADITYDEEVCEALAESYENALKLGGTGLLAATVRNEDTLAAFVRACGINSWGFANCRGNGFTS